MEVRPDQPLQIGKRRIAWAALSAIVQNAGQTRSCGSGGTHDSLSLG